MKQPLNNIQSSDLPNVINNNLGWNPDQVINLTIESSEFSEENLLSVMNRIGKKAQENGIIKINHVDLRKFGLGKHHKVDDRPYGGGPGMVLRPEPLAEAIRSVLTDDSYVILLSPQGKVLNSAKSQELSKKSHLILLCGHYEGVDERIIETFVDEEISIGDFVLTNGGPAAIILVEAVSRFVPMVLGHEDKIL